MNYWLLKSEPDTYSIEDLKRDKKTSWTGVRSFAARKNIRAMQKGDTIFFYHSGPHPEIVGEGSVVSLPYPEVDEWTTIDIKFSRQYASPVSREQLLKEKVFKNSVLERQGRLSVQPLTEKEVEVIRHLGA